MRNISFIAIIFSFLISIYCFINVSNINYDLMFLWPLIMGIILVFILINKIKSISITIVSLVSYIKFTIMPFVIVWTNSYSLPIFNQRGQNYYSESIWLEIWCLIVLFLFLILFNKLFIKNNNTDKKINISIIGDRYTYIILFIMALILFIFIARPNNLLSFFIIKVNNDGKRLDENIPLLLMIIRQFIVMAFNLIFVYSIYKVYKKYHITKINHLIIPLLLAIVNIGLIVGERRSLQVYTALSCLFMLIYLFREHKRIILFFITTFSSFILIGMSIYKHLNAFVYSSYSKALEVALTTGKDATGWGIANTMQAYFYGPQSLSSSLSFVRINNFNFDQLIFDIFRSIIGISFFVKEKGILTSVKYNNYLFNDYGTDTGHIIPSSVYGYTFFGFIFSPLFFIMCAFIVTILEKVFRENKFIEIKFISLFILFRICVDIYSNFPQTLSVASLIILTYAILLLSIYLIKKLAPTKILSLEVR
ncbi:hypothetical protein [Macrococcoides canis]|uniref:hypothetical protein n=1 Tax=Macrococcoides canis TaxID=1855823 RepID=UPI00105C6EF8|nr:hypothetical protein [Macrococcus canis]TDM34398.1 hypothetical protein ETI13_01040 [Macrococcus canis]